jgi:oligopeptide transport system substrate-binding protein
MIVTGAVAVTAALLLSACSGSDDNADSGTGGTSSGGPLTIYNSKPENSLIPANTNEQGGYNVVQAVTRGLVTYNPKTAAPELSMAESITPNKDNTVWTVKLKAGQKFQDDTPVTAESFVKAWNYGAYGPNGALNNYFFAPFEGYGDLNTEDPDGDGPKKAPTPKSKELSGLKVVSDTEFTAKLSAPSSVFEVMIGYHVFAPLPESFFADPEAYGKKPIGNGPFQVVSGDPDTGFTLKKWDGYQGADKPAVTEVQFKTYTSDAAGYADLLAGNLDFMDQVPPSALVDNQFEKDLPGRTFNEPIGTIATMTLPSYNKNFKGNPDIGKALSLATDRDTITKSVFNGGRTPATGWVSPVVDGYKAGACGEFCSYDPTKAKEYLAKSSYKGPFTFSYNADGPGNKEMAEAICNSIKNALEVKCDAKAYVDFATFRKDINGRKMNNLFRTSWGMDYPSIQNFLEPLYVTGASANDGAYSNKKFDALINTANGQSGEEALATYQQAEALLAQDMNVIPLWYYAQQSGWSERLSNANVTPFGTLDLIGVEVK